MPVLAALSLLGPGAGSALAAQQTPASHQYGGVAGGGTHVEGVAVGGALPFTGANLLVYAGAGVGMAAAGFALRSMAGHKRTALPR